MIAISAPIRGGKGGPDREAVGLLSARIRFGDLAGWLSEGAQLSHGGSVVVLNRLHRDGQRCPLLTPEGIIERATPESRAGSYPRLAFPEIEKALADVPHDSPADTEYTSPLDQKVYLAGCARTTEQPGDDEGAERPLAAENDPMRRLDWVVIVQHEKAKAEAPLERLRTTLGRLRLLSFLGNIVLVAGVFLLVLLVLTLSSRRA
jgi:hypothetical protein